MRPLWGSGSESSSQAAPVFRKQQCTNTFANMDRVMRERSETGRNPSQYDDARTGANLNSNRADRMMKEESRDMPQEKKLALVTWANKGIGFELARQLGRNGEEAAHKLKSEG